MPRKGKRPPKASAAAQPARFGIQHFFQRQASPSSQPQEIALPVKQEHVDNGHRKRVKLPPSEVSASPQGSDDGSDEIVWEASPTAERWQGLKLALRPCQSGKNVSVSITSPRLKLNDPNKENVPITQPTSKQQLLRVPSPAPQCKARSVIKHGSKRQGKRKVLLDLLDQVELVISDDKKAPGSEPCVVQPASHIPKNDDEQHTNVSRIAEDTKPDIYYLVLEVTESEYQKEHGPGCYPQKVLRLFDEKNAVEKLVHLRDEWSSSVVRPGDTVNIIGDFGADNKCIVDHKANLLVLHPDVLVSGSRVGSSFSCSRRAVLNERLKSFDSSMAALLGTMLHRLFQKALTAEKPSHDDLQVQAKRIVLDHIDGLYALAGNQKEALIKLVDAIPPLLDWLQTYRNPKESSEANIDFGMGTGERRVAITEVVDIEEMILSPKYGLKGMIDASVRVDEEHMPLEFKTGRATTGQAGVEHRAQVILYTLLMSDRYSQDVNQGMLYYLHTKQTLGIQAQRADVTGLLMRRNEHASHLLRALSTQALPPMLQSSHMCRGCPLLDVCTMYHKVQDGGTGESSGLGEVFDAFTAHLNHKHGKFLQHWEHLIDLEAQLHFSTQSEIWRPCGGQREERNRCLSSMVITSFNDDKERPGSVIYRFQKAASSSNLQKGNQEQIFTLGDYVLLSTESGFFALAGGIVRSINPDFVMVSVSRALRLPGTTKANRIFHEVWRLDRDDSSSSFAVMRYNVLQLFVRDGARRSRELIVDLEAPVFDNFLRVSQDPASTYVNTLTNLNKDQRSAIGKIISARDYCLILGMPGTGKTSTIVYAVRALLLRGLSILLASYTNSAIDNILLKLKSQGVDFVRVGRPETIHPELVQHAIGTNVTSVDELSLKISQARVVGTTCLGITHALFSRRKFDVCIVDEAGQITLPVCLGPLRYARAFVLVGDHYQLPPLVQSAEAREKGMAISLFRKLSEAHPFAVAALEFQYRMCSAIMNLSNVLIYGNRLRCGSTEVANARLYVDISKGLPPWTQQVLDCALSVLFLDVDNISSQDRHHGHAKHNSVECSVLIDILHNLKKGGVDTRSVGVISPYKGQVDYIRQRISDNGAGLADVEVHTIDKYQGKDKDCILVSFALSEDHRVLGSLLTDWHRINVAITRAKKKLIMIGSMKALSSIPLLELLIQQVQDQGGLVRLPEDPYKVVI
ncbi:DNA replication ATP-dependent helicase/nuclease DNA2 isoform X1 [Selaginella moellendorffii]|uniref:DNA replication ATP-dependent helicase/nuclease DNA2 isoform X1 n=1 Tax=Selaginella moellendorffii TaxID=88036 RepID=UPI000D1CC042|nr:DNA replication ATP-dependent helicase/nuclease DNA2 isoform X1 [Selaginella moellendorffii]|eukprot:XP_024544852.1 DNA replication ATP-dependent helicase/nuclease DNA2 isoform X1 [Selaginella moellendorffii]